MLLTDLLHRAEAALNIESRSKLPVFLQVLFSHWNEELEQVIATGLARQNALPELVSLQARAADISTESSASGWQLIEIEREFHALLLGLDQRVRELMAGPSTRRSSTIPVEERAALVAGGLAVFIMLLSTKGVDLSRLDRHSQPVKPAKPTAAKLVPQPASQGEATSLLSIFREASEAARTEFVENLSLEERGELFSQIWSSAPKASKIKLLEQVQGADRQELFDVFQRVKEQGYKSYLFGAERPTVPRLNQWLRQHADRDLETHEKPLAARAVTYYRDQFQATLVFEHDNEKVACTLTTENRGKDRSPRFILRERGKDQRVIAKQVTFPSLIIEK